MCADKAVGSGRTTVSRDSPIRASRAARRSAYQGRVEGQRRAEGLGCGGRWRMIIGFRLLGGRRRRPPREFAGMDRRTPSGVGRFALDEGVAWTWQGDASINLTTFRDGRGTGRTTRNSVPVVTTLTPPASVGRRERTWGGEQPALGRSGRSIKTEALRPLKTSTTGQSGSVRSDWALGDYWS